LSYERQRPYEKQGSNSPEEVKHLLPTMFHQLKEKTIARKNQGLSMAKENIFPLLVQRLGGESNLAKTVFGQECASC